MELPPGPGTPAAASPQTAQHVAAHAATPVGRSSYRNVAWVNAAGARKADNNPAGCKAGRKNLAELALGAGPRAVARRRLYSSWRCFTRSRYRRLCWRGVPCPPYCCGSIVPRANAANGVLPADSDRCKSVPEDSGVGTSVHSPSAGTADSHKDGVGRADVLDLDGRVVETDVRPRELDPER